MRRSTCFRSSASSCMRAVIPPRLTAVPIHEHDGRGHLRRGRSHARVAERMISVGHWAGILSSLRLSPGPRLARSEHEEQPWAKRTRQYAVSQASGMVSVQAECSVPEALGLLKDRAFVSHETLETIATAVVAARDHLRGAAHAETQRPGSRFVLSATRLPRRLARSRPHFRPAPRRALPRERPGVEDSLAASSSARTYRGHLRERLPQWLRSCPRQARPLRRATRVSSWSPSGMTP